MAYLRSFQYHHAIFVWTRDWEIRTFFMMSLNENGYSLAKKYKIHKNTKMKKYLLMCFKVMYFHFCLYLLKLFSKYFEVFDIEI